MRLRRSLLATTTLSAVVMLLAGCTTPLTDDRRTKDGQPGARVPAADWRACPDVAEETLGHKPPGTVRYECAEVTVPRDWADPGNGETLEVALLRARPERAPRGDRRGSLLVNPGGPGGSGIDAAVYLSPTLPSEVTGAFDIVGFDPRGVGRSSPVECWSDEDKDALVGAEPDPATKREFDEVVRLLEGMVDDCTAKYGGDLRYFSTEQTARDMDAIRQALGDEKLSYLGYSYGTLLGAVYAKLFPDNIRAMVLDGAVDPREDEVEASEGQAAGFERAFDRFAEWCERRGQDRCPIGPDARASVERLVDAARAEPLKGSDDRVATAGWVLSAVVYTLYVRDWWPRLADALQRLRDGDPSAVFDIVDTFNEREPDGDYPNSMEVLTLVNCVDEADPPSVRDVRRLQLEWRRTYPLFGGPLAMSIAGCAVWPDQHDPFPYGTVKGAPPIMVVGTTGDPATPYEQSQALSRLLGRSVLVTYRGDGHTAYPKAGCLNDVVHEYLLDLRTPKSAVTC